MSASRALPWRCGVAGAAAGGSGEVFVSGSCVVFARWADLPANRFVTALYKGEGGQGNAGMSPTSSGVFVGRGSLCFVSAKPSDNRQLNA